MLKGMCIWHNYVNMCIHNNILLLTGSSGAAVTGLSTSIGRAHSRTASCSYHAIMMILCIRHSVLGVFGVVCLFRVPYLDMQRQVLRVEAYIDERRPVTIVPFFIRCTTIRGRDDHTG